MAFEMRNLSGLQDFRKKVRQPKHYLYVCNYSSRAPSPCAHCVSTYLKILKLEPLIRRSQKAPAFSHRLRQAVTPKKIGRRHLIIFQHGGSVEVAEIPNLPYPSCAMCKGKGVSSGNKGRERIKGSEAFNEIIGDKKIIVKTAAEYDDLRYCGATPFINPNLGSKFSEAYDYSFGISGSRSAAFKTAWYEAIERFYTFSKPQRDFCAEGKASDHAEENYISPAVWDRKLYSLNKHGTSRNVGLEWNKSYRWYKCFDLDNGEIFAPEHALFCNTWKLNKDLYLSSSGCAVASNLEESRFRAALELIERDCALRSWVTRNSGYKIENWAMINAQLSALARHGQKAGIEIAINEISDVPGVFVVIAILISPHGEWPACSIGTSAKLCQADAVEHALNEAILNFSLQKRRGENHINLPEYFDRPVKTHPLLHNHYYGYARNVRHLKFWLNAKQSEKLDCHKVKAGSLKRALSTLKNTGKQLYFYSLEPTYISDMGYFVTRCISPDVAELTFQVGSFYLPIDASLKQIDEEIFRIPHPFC